MANYTLELRKIIKGGINIFPQEYELYNNAYKEVFENKFIRHFYFREIGVETIERFKYNLETMLLDIMPYYTHLYETTTYVYDPTLNYDVKETITRDVVGNTNTSSRDRGIDGNRQYDTPITKNNDYTTSPSFINDNKHESLVEGTGKSNTTENNTRVMQGNIGVMSTQDLIMKEREIIINIDKLIFEELEILFMQIF